MPQTLRFPARSSQRRTPREGEVSGASWPARMNATSSDFTRGWLCRGWYTRSQTKSQTKPRSPENMKADLHPKARAIQGMARAANAPPKEEPLSKMATAMLRSRLGNHSATVLLAPGQLTPSPTPSRKRKAAKANTELANAVKILTSDQKETATARPIR